MKAIAILCLLSFAQVTKAEPAKFHITIQGRWSGSAKDGSEISYSFTKDGDVTWYVVDENSKPAFPKGLVGKYKITIAKPYWKIDIHKFEHPMFKDVTFMGIFEVLGEKSFRLEGVPSKPSNRGKRPQKFTDEAITFKAAKAAKEAKE